MPETVVDLARLTREAIGDDAPLCVDVGYLWNDVGVATRVARRLEELDVFFLETPFPVDSLEAYARLAAQSSTRPSPASASRYRTTSSDTSGSASIPGPRTENLSCDISMPGKLE
jgi:L-alanine-DL-glutamate epimerase-like enolase superfamily enzyme